MDANTQIALANEARRIELKQKVAKLQGLAEAQSQFATLASTSCGDSGRRLQAALNELTALEAGAGPGLTDDFGLKADHLAAFLAQLEGAGLLTDPAAARTIAGL